jgi:hypothetical protein
LEALSEVEKAAEKSVKTQLEISVNVDNSSESEQEDGEDYRKGISRSLSILILIYRWISSCFS